MELKRNGIQVRQECIGFNYKLISTLFYFSISFCFLLDIFKLLTNKL
jgi:hypothetical protein